MQIMSYLHPKHHRTRDCFDSYFLVNTLIRNALQTMNIKTILIIICTTLTGCSGVVQMMPRDSGKKYIGTVQGNGMGVATMSIDIDGEQFTGQIVRTESNVFRISAVNSTDTGITTGLTASSGTLTASRGTSTVKGILSSASGRGLRCEFVSNGSGGNGICVDDLGHVMDAIVFR